MNADQLPSRLPDVVFNEMSPPNPLVQLQAHYHHCGEAASEKCLSGATFVRRQRSPDMARVSRVYNKSEKSWLRLKPQLNCKDGTLLDAVKMMPVS